MGEEREIQPNARDSLARLLAISALVLAFCVFIAVLVLAPLTLSRLLDTSDKLADKLGAERFVELQAKVNSMEHNIMLMEVGLMRLEAEGEKKPVVFPKIKNATTNTPDLGVVARNKRSVKEDFNNSYSYNYSGNTSTRSSGGTVYIRWGRNVCPSTHSTSLLYTGVVGASHSGHTGGGSNHQCLPLEPQFEYTQKGKQYGANVGGSLLVGVEYKVDNIYPFDNSNNGGNSLNTEDAVCAMCFVQQRSVSIMIPAQTMCPEGWIFEYKGYLMSSHYKNFRVDYICVDRAPDAKQSGGSTIGNSYLYPVEVMCGALPCPNYTDGFELACVVCTH